MENIMIKLQNSPFEYREKLYIPKRVNFGLELELDKVNPKEVNKAIKNSINGNWNIHEDKSLAK